MKKDTNATTHNDYELIEAVEAMHRAAIDAFSIFIHCATGGDDEFEYELPLPSMTASSLLSATAARFRMHNEGLPEEEQWPVPTELTPHQIALLVLAYFSDKVRVLPWMDDLESPLEELLFSYQAEGPKKGLYAIGASEFIREFEPGMGAEKESQVEYWLTRDAEKGAPCVRDDLVALNNGIFNRRTKALMPFSPEHIFLTKDEMNYIPDMP